MGFWFDYFLVLWVSGLICFLFQSSAWVLLHPVRRVRDVERREEGLRPHQRVPRGRILSPEPVYLPLLTRLQVRTNRRSLGLNSSPPGLTPGLSFSPRGLAPGLSSPPRPKLWG